MFVCFGAATSRYSAVFAAAAAAAVVSCGAPAQIHDCLDVPSNNTRTIVVLGSRIHARHVLVGSCFVLAVLLYSLHPFSRFAVQHYVPGTGGHASRSFDG